MKFEEERYAQELHRALWSDLSPGGIDISMTGAGVHWQCIAAVRGRDCGIHCFALRDRPQYLIEFRSDGKTIAAHGRTSSQPDAIDAVRAWVGGAGVAALYDRFPFVDRQKRALVDLHAQIVKAIPSLSSPEAAGVKQDMGDIYNLSLSLNDRACEVFHYGEDPVALADFMWDGCWLFRVKTNDLEQFLAMVRAWLADRDMPSAMRKAFPWIEMSAVADAYEAGRGVEGEFIESWNRVERFFTEHGQSLRDPILHLIREIRAAGYDRLLRAGQFLWHLVISRSRRHGLRQGQPRILFEWTREVGMRVRVSGSPGFDSPRIELTPDLRAALDELVKHPIE